MSFLRFFAMLFAIAMMAAPLGVPAMAEAAAIPSHHGEMAKQGEGSQGSGHAQHGGKAAGGHCDEQLPSDDHGQAADKNCCFAMCVAAIVPTGVAGMPAYHAPRERPRSELARRGFLSEIATPPPRISVTSIH